MQGWIGVDLDGTMAIYNGWQGATHIGEPIAPMLERVKQWLSEGKDVRIFTARVWPIGIERKGLTESEYERRRDEALVAHTAIRQWCEQHIGRELPITCTKDYGMVELWDDRAVQVVLNTGVPAVNFDFSEAARKLFKKPEAKSEQV